MEEQRTLEQGLVKWPQERTPALERYLRIAATLPAKGVRDVALRVRWMQRFAQQKRRVSRRWSHFLCSWCKCCGHSQHAERCPCQRQKRRRQHLGVIRVSHDDAAGSIGSRMSAGVGGVSGPGHQPSAAAAAAGPCGVNLRASAAGARHGARAGEWRAAAERLAAGGQPIPDTGEHAGHAVHAA